MIKKNNRVLYKFFVLVVNIALLLFVSFSQVSNIVFAENFDTDKGIDVVVVIDNSGSMQRADPHKLAREAATLLLDSLLGYSYMKDTALDFRFGVVMYDVNVIPSATIPMISLKDPMVRENVNESFNRNYTQMGEYTDTPDGLNEALNIFESDDIGNRKCIILLTDGLDNVRFAGNEFRIDSLRNDTLNRLAELEIPIFAIGFEFDPKQPVLDESLMDMAGRAGAGGKYYFVSNYDQFALTMLDIRGIVTQNTAILIDDENVTLPEQYFDIPIPNSYVKAASIYILTMAQIDELMVFFEDDAIDKNDNRVLITQDMRSYRIVRLSNPESGLWRVRMSGQEGISYDVIYIYDYSLAVNTQTVNYLEEISDEFYLGDGYLEGWLIAEEKRVSDLRIYDGVYRAFFSVEDADGNYIGNFPAELQGDVYRLSLDDFEAGVYYFKFFIEHEHFNRTTNEAVRFTILNEERPASTVTPTSAQTSAPELLSTPHSDNENESSNLFDFRWLGIILVLIGIGIAFISGFNRNILIDNDIHKVLDKNNSFCLVGRGYPEVESNSVKIITDDVKYDNCKFAKIVLSSCPLQLYRLGVVIESFNKEYQIKIKSKIGKSLTLSSGNQTVTVVETSTGSHVGFAAVSVDSTIKTTVGGGTKTISVSSYGGLQIFLMLLSPVLILLGIVLIATIFLL